MARPRPTLPDAAAILALADAEGRVAVRVTPGAASEAIGITDGVLAIRIGAPPVDGAANDAVLRLLAKALGRAPSRLELVRGKTGRNKVVRLLD